MSTTQTTMKKTFGTRKEVFNGLALKTTGGLTKKDLFFKNGRIKSIKASKRATERMNSNEVLKALFESKQFQKKQLQLKKQKNVICKLFRIKRQVGKNRIRLE